MNVLEETGVACHREHGRRSVYCPAVETADARDDALRLGFTEEPAVTAPLLAALGDSDAAVREAVAWAPGKSEDPTAIELLMQVLTADPDPGG